MKRYEGGLPSRPINSSDHESILAVLPEYVTMQILAQQISPAWHILEQHLLHCSICRSEADALTALMSDSYSGKLPIAPTPPPPILTFLDRGTPHALFAAQPANAAGAPVRPPQRQQIVIRFSTALLPQIRVQMAARTGGVRLHYAYEIPATDAASPAITVEVLVHDDQPEIGLVRVCVEYPDRDPFDQAGSRVILQIGDVQWSAVTDQNGVAAFHSIHLDQIDQWQITIAPTESGGTATESTGEGTE